MATPADVEQIHMREKRLFELIDGVLVEKGMGYWESLLAATIARLIGNWVAPRKLGAVTGADGMLRLFPDQVRIPDVAYVSWGRFPEKPMRREALPHLVPDLAVEVLSESNTKREMARKCGEYFDAGVRLVWIVDPNSRTVVVFTGMNQSTTFNQDQILDGGDVLPGFTLSLKELFAELPD
jgi:Uma2 family endonuclease